jgi:hypothetical protein
VHVECVSKFTPQLHVQCGIPTGPGCVVHDPRLKMSKKRILLTYVNLFNFKWCFIHRMKY